MSGTDPFLLVRDQIYERFDSMDLRMDDRFDSMNQHIDDRTGELWRQVEDVKKILNGNGNPGLVRSVDRLEQWKKDVVGGDHSAASRSGSVYGAISGLLTAAIVGALAYFGIKPPQ